VHFIKQTILILFIEVQQQTRLRYGSPVHIFVQTFDSRMCRAAHNTPEIRGSVIVMESQKWKSKQVAAVSSNGKKNFCVHAC